LAHAVVTPRWDEHDGSHQRHAEIHSNEVQGVGAVLSEKGSNAVEVGQG